MPDETCHVCFGFGYTMHIQIDWGGHEKVVREKCEPCGGKGFFHYDDPPDKEKQE